MAAEYSRTTPLAEAFTLPLRVRHWNTALADTGDHEGHTAIEDAKGDQLCEWLDASDWQEEVATLIVDSINAGGLWRKGRFMRFAPRGTESEITSTVTSAMVDRFLSWPMPDSVCSDGCVTQRNYGKAQGWPKRSGTNLLTADEARQMLEYVLTSPQ